MQVFFEKSIIPVTSFSPPFFFLSPPFPAFLLFKTRNPEGHVPARPPGYANGCDGNPKIRLPNKVCKTRHGFGIKSCFTQMNFNFKIMVIDFRTLHKSKYYYIWGVSKSSWNYTEVKKPQTSFSHLVHKTSLINSAKLHISPIIYWLSTDQIIR